MKRAIWMVLGGLLLLTGCGQFFPPQTSTSSSGSGSGSGGSGTSGNPAVGSYLYVANSNPSLSSLAGFSLASGALANISSSNTTVPLPPTSLAISPNDDFLYAASATGAIYVYVINSSNGSIHIGNSGNPVAQGVFPAALQVDSTGNWLIGVDALSGEAYVYQITAGTGVLTSVTNSTIALTTTANQMVITPNDDYVYVALGTGGVETLSFNSTDGALAQVNSVLPPKQNLDADLSLAVSPTGNYLYVTETGVNAVRVLSIGGNGGLAEISGSPFATGLRPDAVLVDATGSYVYVANNSANTISAFSISSTTGALTQISGSPFSTGIGPTAMVEDKSKTYLAVVNEGTTSEGGNPDLQVFTFSTTTPGALVSFQTATTGTDPTEAIAIATTY
jgi:6-phosphogluconolactonase